MDGRTAVIISLNPLYAYTANIIFPPGIRCLQAKAICPAYYTGSGRYHVSDRYLLYSLPWRKLSRGRFFLTPEGHKRAGALYRLLKDSGISKIYTTPYIRSIETADSFRIYRHLDTCIYQADTVGESFIYQLSRREDWGKRIFVVAHRYTILPILHSLRAEIRMTNDDLLGSVKTAKDSIGNMLFIVRKTSAGTELKELRIGNVE